MQETDSDDDDGLVMWHENRIRCNEFNVSKVLYVNIHRFLQNALNSFK
jgi:hypothetical protein